MAGDSTQTKTYFVCSSKTRFCFILWFTDSPTFSQIFFLCTWSDEDVTLSYTFARNKHWVNHKIENVWSNIVIIQLNHSSVRIQRDFSNMLYLIHLYMSRFNESHVTYDNHITISMLLLSSQTTNISNVRLCLKCPCWWCLIDIDECTESGSNDQETPQHDCEQICTNLPWTYECQCNIGFTLDDDERHCNDVDECITGNHDCTGLLLCINSIGSFQCICPPGYTKEGMSCTNIDECSAHLDDCSQGCVDTPGSYYCYCHVGFISYSSDNKTCQDVDECQADDHNCSGLFECINTRGRFECMCRVGYSLVHATGDFWSCIDDNECDRSNGNCDHGCQNTDGSYVCTCDDNSMLESDGQTLCTEA